MVRYSALLVLVLVLALAAVAGCGAERPYAVAHGLPSMLATETRDVRFSETGFRAVIGARCGRSVIENWCAPSQPKCRPKPVTVRREPVVCPADLDLSGAEVSIRSPWGVVYKGTADSAGVAQIPIDWAQSGIDPLAEKSREQLLTGWTLSAGESGDDTAVVVSESDLETILTVIGEATDTQYTTGAANERASLTVELVDPGAITAGVPVPVQVSIRNDGPQPAYRAVARFRSSVDALHGLQFSFGRIDAGQTKVRVREVVVPVDVDDRSPLVVAVVSYFNGESITTQKRLSVVIDPNVRVTSSQALALKCKAAAPEVAPGERVRMQCTLRNGGSAAATGLSYSVAVAGAVTPNTGPPELAAGDEVTLELVGSTSTGAKQGASIEVVVTVQAPGGARAEQTLAVGIASFAGMCRQGKLTREQYRLKRKRLEAALAAGALTQTEFDDYDAELVSCIE